MKILDEIMARDRAGTPVTYRDLLPVVEAVRRTEDILLSWRDLALQFDADRMQVRAHLSRVAASPTRARCEEALGYLGEAPRRPLDVFTEAFEKWETAHRAGETLSHEEAAQMTVQEAAAHSAAHFLKLLGEVQL